MVTAENRAKLEKMMLESVQKKTLEEWMDTFVNQTADVAAEPYTAADEGMNHTQIVHNGQILDVEDPRLGKTRQLGPLVLMTETPGSPKGPAQLPASTRRKCWTISTAQTRRLPTAPASLYPDTPWRAS